MDIKTKASVGDKVYFAVDQSIYEGKVENIDIFVSQGQKKAKAVIKYRVLPNGGSLRILDEFEIHLSKEDMQKYIEDNFPA